MLGNWLRKGGMMINLQLSDLDFWRRNIQQFVDEDDDDEDYGDVEEDD